MAVKIDYKKCCWKNGKCFSCGCSKGKKCNGCVEVCPSKALERKDIVVIHPEKCIDCGACIIACTRGAVSLN